MEGESGPKARPKGVVDGKQVNIPVLFFGWYRGTKEARVGQNWILVEVFKVMRGRRKTILELRSDTTLFLNCYLNVSEAVHIKSLLSNFLEKLELLYNQKLPVPETDTGRWVEYTKGREITLSKELGKMTP